VTRWASFALATALLLCAGACGKGSGEPRLAPRHRFVDLLHPSQPSAYLPVATLLDERRYVLQQHPATSLVSGLQRTVTLGAHVSLRPKLPRALAGSSRIVLSPHIRSRSGRESLPALVAGVQPAGGEAIVPVELDLPTSAVGSTVLLAIDAVVPPENTQSSLETPPVEIPAGSRLEFGIGILDAARDQGRVAFSVQACEDEDCREVFGETLDPRAPEGRAWHDHAVALDAYAGSSPSFRFETRLVAKRPDAFSLPVWSNPTVYAPLSRAPGDFNIVLISLDTLRADRLPSYGYPLETAPFSAEKFGEEGVIFERLVAAATTTGPSHMSLFTSLQPSVHRVTGIFGERLSPAAPTLAQALRGHGFATAAATENAALDVARGFGRGFESYAENKSLEVVVAEGHIEDTFTRARRWLARNGDKRFFLFLHTYQVHYPYTPPAAYRHLFPEPAAGFEPHPGLPADRDPALYDREIRYVDDQVRRFFQMLEETGRARDTLVVLTSDHGEEFLEHGFAGHGPNVHAEVMHIPLMLWGPGIPPGRRIATPIGLVDLMPTLLELAGVPRPERLMGRSFAHLLTREEPPAPRDDAPIYGEAWYAKSERPEQPTLAVWVGRRKLIRRPTESGFRYHYFDLEDDPREQRDLYRDAEKEARDLKRLLDAYSDHALSTRAALLRQEQAMAPPSEIEPSLDPDRDAKLRALGYLE
jgi:arylsulfatase A-like enzyme